MTDKLSLYNGALRLCEERKLASLTEDSARRHELDGVWDGGAVQECLEAGLFSFAIRTVELTYNSSYEPTFGLEYVFDLPDDFVQLVEISADEMLSQPHEMFRIEGGRIFSNIDTLYVAYVSNGSAYGGDMSLWPRSFCSFVEAFLASRIVARLTSESNLKEQVRNALTDAKREAMGKDALKKPARKFPRGSWVAARRCAPPQRN